MTEEKLISPVRRLARPVRRLTNSISKLKNSDIRNTSFHGNEIYEIKNDYEHCKQQYEQKHSHQVLHGRYQIIKDYVTFQIPNQIKWISDYMMRELVNWSWGQYIFINCPTGSGKTTFMEKTILSTNGPVLILTNRKANKQQIINHFQDTGFIETGKVVVTSYQELELNEIYTSEYIDTFVSVFLDESHYFLQDANFNPTTNVSLRLLMRTKRCIKIFMSATNDNLCHHIILKLLNYYKNDGMVMSMVKIYEMRRHNFEIENIISLTTNDSLCEKIIKDEYKWLIFVTTIKEGTKLETALKLQGVDVVFLDRDSADKGTKEQKQTFNSLIKEEKFYQKVLIATSLLDNGVNIKDLNLKNIVIYHFDRVEIAQMLGRKRILNENDTVNLYLVDEDIEELQSLLKAKLKHKSAFKKVKRDIEEIHVLDKCHYQNNDKGNTYRTLSYYDLRTGGYSVNYLGLHQTNIEIKMLFDLLNLELTPLHRKIEWLFSKETIKACNIVDSYTQKTQEFMKKMSCYLGVTIAKSDKQNLFEFKKYWTNTFWNIYGKQKGDRADRILSLKKIQQYTQDLRIPILLEIDKKNVCIINIDN